MHLPPILVFCLQGLCNQNGFLLTKLMLSFDITACLVYKK